MKKILPLLLLGLTTFAHADKYQSYTELAQNEKEGVDYKIVVLDQNSPVSLIAPHGGLIERGSSELIQEIGGSFNQYHFMGIKKRNNFDLHITSANFDEPQGLAIAAKSKRCVSFHGYIGKGENAVCIGGNNKELAQKIRDLLASSGEDFDVLYPCVKYPGSHPENIVNRCEEAGVQLEMSTTFRDRIVENSSFREKIASLIKNAL